MLSSSSSSISSSSSLFVRCCLSTFQRGRVGRRTATTTSSGNLRMLYHNQQQQQQNGCSSSLISSLNKNEEGNYIQQQKQTQYNFHSSIRNNNSNNNNPSILLRQQQEQHYTLSYLTSRLSLGTANKQEQHVQNQNQYFSTFLRIQDNSNNNNTVVPSNRVCLLNNNSNIITKRTFASKRHKRLLKHAKGFRGRSKNCFTIAIRRVERSWEHAKVDRKLKHRLYRKLWIMKIQAATRIYNISYSRFIPALQKSNIQLNRKVLATLASHEPFSFKSIIDVLTTQGTVQINNPQNYVIPTTILGPVSSSTSTGDETVDDDEKDTVPTKYRR